MQRVYRRQRLGIPALEAPVKPTRPASWKASKERVEARRLERVAEEALAQETLAQLSPGDAGDEMEAARRYAARARGAAA
jgi:hypothetical protein